MSDKHSKESQSNEVYFCPECQTGLMHMRYLTYFTWLNEELITVSNFPAWVCDLCGKRDYDHRAVNWLNTLLNPETGRLPKPKRKLPPSLRAPGSKKPAFPA
jgi:YgiT-type zinc finger domain-containing protein